MAFTWQQKLHDPLTQSAAGTFGTRPSGESVPVGAKDADRDAANLTASAFWTLLEGDAELRGQCADRKEFDQVFRAWQASVPGYRGGPGAVLYSLTRFHGKAKGVRDGRIEWAAPRAVPAPPPYGDEAGAPDVRPSYWTCPGCSANVFASKIVCFRCRTPKPGCGGPGQPPAAGGGPDSRTEQTRACLACQRPLPRRCYSKNQWGEVHGHVKSGNGACHCKSCGGRCLECQGVSARVYGESAIPNRRASGTPYWEQGASGATVARGAAGQAASRATASAGPPAPIVPAKDKQSWMELDEGEQRAATIIGYDNVAWDAGVDVCPTRWCELAGVQRRAATALGSSEAFEPTRQPVVLLSP